MTEKLRLDIQVLLPEIDSDADGCVDRLVSDLQGRPGIEGVHLRKGEGDQPSQLCVHYDPQVQSLARIREVVQAAGAQVTARFGHVLWEVDGIGHERRARTVAEFLREQSGVMEADASAAGTVLVEFDRDQISEEKLKSALSWMGVTRRVKPSDDKVLVESTTLDQSHEDKGHTHGADEKHAHAPGDGHAHAHGQVLGPNTELIFALTCGALLIAGYLVEKLVPTAPGLLPVSFYVAAYLDGGAYTLREAIDNLRMKRFEIDPLRLVAAAGAAALGSWAEGALLLFLFSLGHALEHYAMGRAKRAIEALAELAPETATVRRDGQVHEIPV